MGLYAMVWPLDKNIFVKLDAVQEQFHPLLDRLSMPSDKRKRLTSSDSSSAEQVTPMIPGQSEAPTILLPLGFLSSRSMPRHRGLLDAMQYQCRDELHV